MKAIRLSALAAIVCALVVTPPVVIHGARAAQHATAPAVAAESGASSTPFWTGITDAASFERTIDTRLAHARQLLERLATPAATPTLDNTLRPFDDVLLELDAAGQQAGLIQAVHPDAAIRTIAEKLSQKASALQTEVSLSRPLFDAISKIDVSGADAETKFYVQRLLRDFR